MRSLYILLLLSMPLPSMSQGSFKKYFTDKVLRFDFTLIGNSHKTLCYPVGMKEEPYWGGPNTLSSVTAELGNLKFDLYDFADGTLIYSRGFSTLFQEWQTTAEAKNTERSFYEVASMPYPVNKCRFVLSKRERNGVFSKLYETVFDPADYYILKEKPLLVNSTRIYGSGAPATSVDLAFIAEGYTAEEMGKFRKDVKMMADALFEEEPFSIYKDKFNIWAVEAISQDPGTDVPGESIYANTALNSTFYTFGTARYLTTTDMKSVNDYAASVPHDNIIVLINSNRYGGGGVYNYYSGTTTGHQLSKMVFVHEFGHGFAGLADEYYSSSVAYDELYPLDVEPWEPNITTMVDFGSKWKKTVSDGTPMPTPEDDKYLNTTGLFEGGGYSAKGIFRPEFDCRMKSNGPKGFCTICKEAVKEMIGYYIK